MKGFRVITCTGIRMAPGVAQTEELARYRKYATKEMKPRYYGIMQTVWSGTDAFIDDFHAAAPAAGARRRTSTAEVFKAMNKRVNELETGS